MKNETPIVVTFVNEHYIDLFDLFYNNIVKHNVNLLVVCLDKSTYDKLTHKNISTLYRPITVIPGHFDSRFSFFQHRINIINEIYTQYKTDLIHTDVDCFWLKDVTDVLTRNGKYDLITHIAYNLPRDIAEKMGFVMCCGLFYLKYVNTSENFLNKIIEYMNINQDLDDQELFNYYSFDFIDIKNIQHDCDKDIQIDITLNNDLTIGVINENIVSRKYNENLYCFHPFFKKYTPTRYSHEYIQKKYPLLKI